MSPVMAYIHSEPEITLVPSDKQAASVHEAGCVEAEGLGAAGAPAPKPEAAARRFPRIADESGFPACRCWYRVKCARHVGMSSQLDLQIEHLRSLSITINELREILSNVEGLRGELMREMKREGYPAVELASVADVSRARAYQIFDEPGPDADDDEYAEMAQRLEGAWEYAVESWAQHGEAGTPDDFFPLDVLLARR